LDEGRGWKTQPFELLGVHLRWKAFCPIERYNSLRLPLAIWTGCWIR
jgi:hypothetical protein